MVMGTACWLTQVTKKLSHLKWGVQLPDGGGGVKLSIISTLGMKILIIFLVLKEFWILVVKIWSPDSSKSKDNTTNIRDMSEKSWKILIFRSQKHTSVQGKYIFECTFCFTYCKQFKNAMKIIMPKFLGSSSGTHYIQKLDFPDYQCPDNQVFFEILQHLADIMFCWRQLYNFPN